MDHEKDLETYRSQLLESLSAQPSRSIRGRSEPIQVYVNERRVGELDGVGIDAALRVQNVDRIETVQLRAEDGTLLGGLVAPEQGFRANRVRLASDAVELCVHNTAQGGTLNALFIPSPTFWSRVWKRVAGIADRLTIRRPDVGFAYGMRTVAFTQALLAVAVVGLVADRLSTGMAPERTPSPVIQTAALPAASAADMEKLEQRLEKLTQLQAKIGEALESQQNGMAQVHQAMVKLSSTQESVASSVVTVKEEVKEELEKRLEAVGREMDRTTRHLASRGRVEQGQLEAAIHSLTADNHRLSKEVAGLEENNHALKTTLQAAMQNASKAVDPNPERLHARQADAGRQPLQLAEGLQSTQQQPFLFWVTFSEGTSQESIDQWVSGMKGHKGALNEGWQEVRIVPPAVPPDRFLEQIREDKIVKAARIGQ
ncbi:MAG: hypothetical protein A4E19_05460 [Nitrospira sp. SG-bin1]|nr:MAG: hypothetical protein A4E19_05460 [Nitrospira sp. SG-bin1]